jgi:HSP20 family protein
MLTMNRWHPFDDLFAMEREVDRMFKQFSEARRHAAWASSSPAFHVTPREDSWSIDIPVPGIEPNDLTLEVAGNYLTVRTREASDAPASDRTHFEQTMKVPPFLDIDQLTASHRHGMLHLRVPLKDSVKPRRVQIGTDAEERRQLAAVN